MKTILLSGVIAVLVLLLFSCNDQIEVQKAYDFSLSSWYLQPKIKRGKRWKYASLCPVRDNTTVRNIISGMFNVRAKARYSIRMRLILVNREQIELAALPDLRVDKEGNYTFTLFYRSLSDKKSEIQFIVTDNFGQEQTMMVTFEPDTEKKRIAMKAPVKYYGGKGTMFNEILRHFPPAESYRTYIEPFGGSYVVGLNMPYIPPVEIYNDLEKTFIRFIRYFRTVRCSANLKAAAIWLLLC